MGKIALFTVMLVTCGVSLAVLAAVGWVIDVADSAPDITQLKPRDPGQNSEVFAGNGLPLGYIHSDVLRTEVPGSQIPRILREATVAIEDRRFYQHGGVDYQGLVRAAVRDVFGGGGSPQGGSTLTMQLVNAIYLPSQVKAHHNLRYKIIQAKLAEQLEQKRSRSWILTQYLNDVPYGTLSGSTAYGVQAASELFFDKPVQKLDLAQAALLAGLPQAPSDYNPILDPAAARARRHNVLTAMVASRYITQDQADAADAAGLETKHNNIFAVRRQPYVFDYVQQSLNQHFCPDQPDNDPCPKVDQGGLKIYTTIDLTRQQEAREALLANEGSPGDPAAALVSIDPSNGHILAMATTSTYDQTSFDYATQAHRQTGSAFKVFVLMTLIHDFHGDPNQTYYVSRELLPGWLADYPSYHVQTSEHSYLGTINLTKATALSDNTVYAQLDADVGPSNVSATAHAMGITSHLDSLPAEGIGGLRIGVSPLEMADAYATLADGGVHHPPTAISKVVFPDGSTVDFGDPPHTRVFSDGEAYAATQVLKTVIQYGTGTSADYGCPAAGKTGTTSSYTDAWFVGYTPQLSTSVWVGYPHSTQSMYDVNGLGPGFGGTLAAPIWHDYMSKASNGYCSDFTPPTTPFSGTPFFGHFAVTGGRGASSNSGSSGNSGNSGATGPHGATGASGNSGQTKTNPYNNPTLYSKPPQAPSGNSGNSGNSGKPGKTGGGGGAGGGHHPSGGGAVPQGH